MTTDDTVQVSMLLSKIRQNERATHQALEQIECILSHNSPLYNSAEPPINTIIYEVANHFGISTAELKTRSSRPRIVLPRQVAIYLSRSLTSHSLNEIAREVGGYHHTVVLYGCDTITRKMQADAPLKAAVEYLSQRLAISRPAQPEVIAMAVSA